MNAQTRNKRALEFEGALASYIGVLNRLWAEAQQRGDTITAQRYAGQALHDALQGLTWLRLVLERGEWPTALGGEITPATLHEWAVTYGRQLDVFA